MTGALWSLLGVVAGAALALQAPVNAELARGLGLPVAAAAFSFLSGAIVLGIASVAAAGLTGTHVALGAPAPWLFVAGGCLGGLYVTCTVVLIPRLGATSVMAFALTGQLLASMFMDRIGFLGMAVREVSLGRVAGAALLVAGALMIRVY